MFISQNTTKHGSFTNNLGKISGKATTNLNKLCKTNPILKMTKLTQTLIINALTKNCSPSTAKKTNPNEPNINLGKIDANCLLERNYEKNPLKAQKTCGELACTEHVEVSNQTKPKQTQFSKSCKMSVSNGLTKTYKEIPQLWLKKQTQSNPIIFAKNAKYPLPYAGLQTRHAPLWCLEYDEIGRPGVHFTPDEKSTTTEASAATPSADIPAVEVDAQRLEIHYTPKHGSWLNMAEVEMSVMSRQCLADRMGNVERLKDEVLTWVDNRNAKDSKVDWQFTTADARIKLKKLYPTI